METFLGGVLFVVFIAAQALALLAVHPVSIKKPRVLSDSKLSARGRKLLQSGPVPAKPAGGPKAAIDRPVTQIWGRTSSIKSA
jgi:hypothetical protein